MKLTNRSKQIDNSPMTVTERLYIPAIASGLGITLKHFFKKKVTVNYPEVKRHLAGWVRYQRRREELGVMPGWQRLLLSQVAGFSWDPMGEQWDATCAELEDFLKTQKRVPRYRTTMESERALAAWVHKQRHLNGKGLLPAHRVAALRKLPFRIL